MNIDLIIEALETALKMEWLCEPCEYQCISAGDKCQVDKKIKAAIAEARKMKGLCVWKMVGNLGFAKIYETCRGKFVLTPNIVQAVDYCFKCRRPVKYED